MTRANDHGDWNLGCEVVLAVRAQSEKKELLQRAQTATSAATSRMMSKMKLTLTCLPDHLLLLIQDFVGPQHSFALSLAREPPLFVRSGDVRKLPQVTAWLSSAVVHPDLNSDFDHFVVGIHEVLSEICIRLEVQRIRIDVARENAEKRCVIWFLRSSARRPEYWAPYCVHELRLRDSETPILAFAIGGKCTHAYDVLYGGLRHTPNETTGSEAVHVNPEKRWDLRSHRASRGYRLSSDTLYCGVFRGKILSRLCDSSRKGLIFARGELWCDDRAPVLCELCETREPRLECLCTETRREVDVQPRPEASRFSER